MAAVAWVLIAQPVAAAEVFPPIEIEGPWARINKDDGTVSAYFDIVNHRDDDNTLVEVTSPLAGHVTLSRAKWQGSRLRTQEIEKIEVEGMSRKTLRPGQYFVSLSDLKSAVTPGMSVPLVLHFEGGTEIAVEARINNQLLGNRGRQ